MTDDTVARLLTEPVRDEPSKKQLNFLMALLRKAGMDGNEQEQVWAWASVYMPKRACSELIDQLNSGDFATVAEALYWLRARVGEWAERQEDCPADWEGLR